MARSSIRQALGRLHLVRPRRRTLVIAGLIAVALIALASIYAFVYDPPYAGSIHAQRAKPLVFAHRGFGVYGPDNSLAASKAAMAAGADGVDVDGQLTSDGAIVIFHDLSLERLTTGTGKVSSHTLAELQQLDLAPGYTPASATQPYTYAAAPVASFEDFVRTITPQGILMVELKVTSKGDTGIEREALRIIKKYNAFDRVYLSSFNPLVIRRLESLEPRLNTVYIFMDTNWNAELLAEMKPEDKVDLPWFLQKEWTRRGFRKLIRPDMLSVNQDVAPATRAHLIAQGWPVLLWATDTDSQIQNALSQHPYGLISDEPLHAMSARDLTP